MNDKHHQQCSETGALQTFPIQYPIVTGAFSPTGTFNDIFPSILPLHSPEAKGQTRQHESIYTFPEFSSWESIKLPEKIDSLIDITTKDLSPRSYSSHIEGILSVDNYYSRYEGYQWCPNSNNYSHKNGEYASCAQMNKNCEETGATSTNSFLQKSTLEGKKNKKTCDFYTESGYNHGMSSGMNERNYNNYSSYYDSKYNGISSETNYSQNYPMYNFLEVHKSGFCTSENETHNLNSSFSTPVDQQTEVSNNDSDIIVEDSSSDCSENQEKKLFYGTARCLLCDTLYTPSGIQFFVLTYESPLTMSSQTPVIKKIMDIVNKNIVEEAAFLCNDCLELVNTIDNLQLKLKKIINNLMDKFRASGSKNDIKCESKVKPKIQLKQRRFKCRQCKKVFCMKTFFSNHFKTHKLRGYLCELCGKTAPTYKSFKCHLKSHKMKNSVKLSSFECSNKLCKKTFRTKSHLKEHENFCLGIMPFECRRQYCDKKFASATKLKNHVKLKHDKKFIAICSICNIGFVKVSDYKSHMITHNNVKKFSCDKCDKSYKTLSNLNFHFKSHEKTLPYTCSICQKGFVRKEYHEAHMNNHKGVKNFVCTVCDKKFVSQKNLDAHLKYHEGTVKTNTCNICEKIISSGFEEHLRVHSNLKEFECDFCKMKFNTKNTLAKHKKRKH